MAGFEQLEQALDEGQALAPLTEEQIAFSDEELEDQAALAIVLQDLNAAEKHVLSKGLPISWDYYDNLYRAYVKSRPWPGTDTPRSNLSMPLVLEVIEKIMPTLHLAFFREKQPFILEPTGKTSPDAARARAKILNWAIKQAGFKEQIRQSLKHCLLYGFTVGKWGWTTSTRTIKKYTTGEDAKVVITKEKIKINHPTFENVDLRKALCDPQLTEQDCRKGAFVIGQVFVTANDLDTMRDDPTYKNIPSREELAVILTNNGEPTDDSLKGMKTVSYRDLQAEPETDKIMADPLSQPLELIERVDQDRVITVLQRKIVIRNEANEFDRVNYTSCAFIDVPGSMYGFGIGKLLAGDQGFEVGVLNAWVDQLTLQLNPAYQLQKGLGPGTQQIRLSPGKVVNETGELKPLVKESVSTEALNAISASEDRATRRVGANGGTDMPTQAMRTAEGVSSFSADIAGKMQYFIEIFSDLVFIPVLEAFIELCNDHLTPEQIKNILSEDDGKAYQGDIMDVYNCTCSLDVLSSTKLAAKKATSQMLPLLFQLVSAAPVQDSLTQQGKKFNYAEAIEEAVELAGMDVDSLILDMTPDDMKRAMMLNQQAMRAQGDLAKQAQQHQFDMESIQEQGMVRGGLQVIKAVVDKAKETGDLGPLASEAGGLLNPAPQPPANGGQ